MLAHFFLQARSSHLLSASAGPTALFFRAYCNTRYGWENKHCPPEGCKQTDNFWSLRSPRLRMVSEFCFVDLSAANPQKAAAARCSTTVHPLWFADLPCGLSFNGETAIPFCVASWGGSVHISDDCQALVLNCGKKNGLKAFACVQCKPFLPVQGASKGCLTDVFFNCTEAVYQVLLTAGVPSRLLSYGTLFCTDNSASQAEWKVDSASSDNTLAKLLTFIEKGGYMNNLDCCWGCLGEFKSISSESAPISPASQHAY